MQEGIGRSF
ncbi:hypothetical protein ZEAMMB73_Zm00001d008312 [Zea mays]|uniref:Uncharacterized protein n=1 Tax=Zea mays TaxID=4577 RepID=A0A1D6FBT2_MAIZE|nr:hypothetical protein ZEAMMB73_Zm00001d008312 [Zea mays]